MASVDIGARGSTPVLLLKTKSSPNDGYEEQFSAAGDGTQFQPIFVPVLEHKFLEDGLNVVRSLLKEKVIGKYEKSKYGGMIFTSQRAVEAFAKLVEEGQGDHAWPHLQDIPIYTVGPATSRALRWIPQNPPLHIFGAESGDGEALAHYMLDHYGEWYKDRAVKPPLLFLVGEQRRDIIPKTLMDRALPNSRKIQVDELPIYSTGVMEPFEEDFTEALAKTNDVKTRWVVVFSPTGCEAMLRVLGYLNPKVGKTKKREEVEDKSTLVITIGPTTRDYLRNKFGFEPDICAVKPSPEGLIDGIMKFESERKPKE